MRLVLVRIWRDNLPKYGRAITNFFLGAVLTTDSKGCANILRKYRLCEQLGISALTGKRVNGDDDSTNKEHLILKISQFLQSTTMSLKSR